MQARTDRRPVRARRAVLGLASAALVAVSLPALATSASAETGDRLTMLDRSGGGSVVSSWFNDGSGGATSALAANYYAFGYDVSRDGKTWVAALRTGDGTTDNADAVYALVLVHDAGGTNAVTRVIASLYDLSPAPVISADGTKVWWMADGDIWQYTANTGDWSAAGTIAKKSTKFRPASGETAAGLAVSPGGTRVAVVYQKADGTSRIRATGLSWNGTSPSTIPYYGKVKTDPNAFISGDVVFVNDSTVLYQTTNSDSSITTSFTGTLATPSGAETNVDAQVQGRYRIRKDASDEWWMWSDSGSSPVVSSYIKAANPLAPGSPSTNTFPLGDTTTSYAPVSNAPKRLTVAKNAATANAQLYMSGTVVGYNKRLAYLSYASYLAPLPGQTASADAFAVFQGTLQYSTNPFATTPVWKEITTSGKSFIGWGSYPAGSFNGTTPYLTRNTWFRWVYPGTNALVKKDTTNGTIKVRVRPDITISKLRSGSATKVYGKITRVGGKAQLQRSSGGSWVTVGNATITSTGTYSFGYRTLRSGTYRVVSVEDTYWASNAKSVSI
ncbi:MAG: hypothetical protein LCI03_11615 [Actinobacteria bacterium]|jgi:hypothetical protein|nr:hypothetical protein [Actinomycetota bacterium]